MFDQELRMHIGSHVQVVTPVEVVSGILVAVTDTSVTVRGAQYPGYGGGEDVTVLLDTVSYVRVTV